MENIVFVLPTLTLSWVSCTGHSNLVLSFCTAHSNLVLSICTAHSNLVLSFCTAHSNLVLSFCTAHSNLVLSFCTGHSNLVLSICVLYLSCFKVINDSDMTWLQLSLHDTRNSNECYVTMTFTCNALVNFKWIGISLEINETNVAFMYFPWFYYIALHW